MAEETKRDAYGALFDMGRVFLQQTTTAQRSVFDYYRQFTERESAGRSLRVYQEEVLRKTMEGLEPFFTLELATRQQVLKAQASLFDLCDETLRGFARYGAELRTPRST